MRRGPETKIRKLHWDYALLTGGASAPDDSFIGELHTSHSLQLIGRCPTKCKLCPSYRSSGIVGSPRSGVRDCVLARPLSLLRPISTSVNPFYSISKTDAPPTWWRPNRRASRSVACPILDTDTTTNAAATAWSRTNRHLSAREGSPQSEAPAPGNGLATPYSAGGAVTGIRRWGGLLITSLKRTST